MFSARITDSLGAPEAVQAAYLIERRLELPDWQELVFQVRHRLTGQRVWIKCSDGSPASDMRLESEGRLLARLAHPNILPLAAPDGLPACACLIFPWSAETVLASLSPAGWSAADRSRLALALLDVLSYLQGLPQPVAHGALHPDNLWITPGIHWLKLTGFGLSIEAASDAELQADREEAWRIVSQLVAPAAAQITDPLGIAGRGWVDQGWSGLDPLRRSLKLSLLEYVTTDL